MSYPGGRGRADYLALGDWNTVCYQCGRKRKASTLRKHWQGYYVCPEHWEVRQPQDFVRSVPDKQTPPWVQPMPEDVFQGPTTYTLDTEPVVGVPIAVTVDATNTGAVYFEVPANGTTPAQMIPVIPAPAAGTYVDGGTYVFTPTYSSQGLILIAAVSTIVEITGGTSVNVFEEAGSPVTAGAFTIVVTGVVTQMDWGSGWPVGCTFLLINQSMILGRGGDGGGYAITGPNGEAGSDGTYAIWLQGYDVTIDNSDGYIFGGGGGGGAGGRASMSNTGVIAPNVGSSATCYEGTGGGGVGSLATAGGTPGHPGTPSYRVTAAVSGAAGSPLVNTLGTLTAISTSLQVAQLGTEGTGGSRSGVTGTPGTGGLGGVVINLSDAGSATSGGGGAGGDWGEDGTAGNTATASGNVSTSVGTGGAGGAAGAAIEQDGGTATFSAGNTADRVKGAII